MSGGSHPSRGLVLAVFALLTLIWGTTWAGIRISLEGFPPFWSTALRHALAAVLLLAAAWWLRLPLGRAPRERTLWVVNAALSFCGSYGIVYWCEQWVPSGLAAVLFATFPLFVAGLSRLLLPGERLDGAAWGGIGCGFLGVAVIYSEDFAALGGPQVALASAVMLASPLLSALGTVLVKKWGRAVHPLSLTAVPMALTAGVMTGVALATERGRPLHLAAAPVAALVYLAVFGSAVSFSLYFWLMRHVTATQVATIAYTTPLVAVALGTLWLGEPFTARTAAGALLVVGGVALASMRRR